MFLLKFKTIWGERMARERKFSMEELYQLTKETLLQHGYEGFTFSLIAEQLDISRGTIYKYYENKDELITDYMIYEMNLFLIELKDIEKENGFDAKFEFLIDTFFKHSKIYKIIEIGQRIPITINERVRKNKENLGNLHLEMYRFLYSFIQLGKEERKINERLPEQVMLGYIFQSIAIPNHTHIPHDEWVSAIKEIISHGIIASN